MSTNDADDIYSSMREPNEIDVGIDKLDETALREVRLGIFDRDVEEARNANYSITDDDIKLARAALQFELDRVEPSLNHSRKILKDGRSDFWRLEERRAIREKNARDEPELSSIYPSMSVADENPYWPKR